MNNSLKPTRREIAERKRLIRTLAQERRRQSISQDKMAMRMRTQQPCLARLERGLQDPQFLTLQRYAASLGKRIAYQLVELDETKTSEEVPESDVSRVVPGENTLQTP